MDRILVLDFGGQYDQLIARRVRDLGVYAEIRYFDAVTLDEIRSYGYSGIIFTGGPASVYDEASPRFDPKILDAGLPILGICYGAQLMAWMAGGEVKSAETGSEYGKTLLKASPGVLFEGVPGQSICW
ncbi:MAG: gamma-glutamyl-gamma-aminobutyrate hydrolase family protein, partial [Eubacteriaceae bacterium]|nr:gamma-glutamyl-gamma-aminobutyrate hydrolase family protein [Eubacteriaceae bacterium]